MKQAIGIVWVLLLFLLMACGSRRQSKLENNQALTETSTDTQTDVEASEFTLALSQVSDTGYFNDDRITKETTPAFHGTGSPRSEVVLKIGSTVVGRAQVAEDGTWLVQSIALSDGLHAVDAFVQGRVFGTLEFRIDTVPPREPLLDLHPSSDSGRSDVDNNTNDNTPLVTISAHDQGLSEWDQVRYRIYDRVDDISAEVLVLDSFVEHNGFVPGGDAGYNLSLAGGLPLPDAVHNFTAVVEDLAGNISPAGMLQIRIDTN